MVSWIDEPFNRSLAFWTDGIVREAAVSAIDDTIASAFGRRVSKANDEAPRFASEGDIQSAETFGRITEAEAARERAMLAHRLQESAPTLTGGRVQLQESTAGTPTLVGGRRIRVTLIDPGLGASGWYPKETLEAAARDKVFPEGLPIYLDHPSSREAQERPERSVRDLAGLLVEDAKWSGSALVAEARIVPAHADLVASLEGVAGMSIRAQGEMEPAEIDGKRVPKITKLLAAESVDIVTKAGRGGRFEVLEGARW